MVQTSNQARTSNSGEINMTDTEQTTEVVRKRFKRRKVQKGLRIVINCDGKQHHIVWTKKGHMVMAHHPDIDLNAELAMRGIGGCEVCRCAKFIGAWRAGGNKIIEVCPQTVSGVRPNTPAEKLSSRLWRKMRSKAEHLHKQQKPAPWPTSEEEMHKFLTDAYDRAGLKYEAEFASVCYDGIKDESVRPDTLILQIEWDHVKNNRFTMQHPSVPGLNYRRYVTPDNYEVLIELVGRYLFRRLVTSELTRQDNTMRRVKGESLQALHRKWGRGINIYTPSYGYDPEIQFSFTVPYLQRGAAAYILKHMQKLKHFAELSVSNRKEGSVCNI